MTFNNPTPIPPKPHQTLAIPRGSAAPARIQCERPNNFLYKIAQKVRNDRTLKQQLEHRVYEMLLRDLQISRERQ